MLRHPPVVQIAELATLFGVSVETVRRDIDGMAEQGLLVRAYGGAAAIQTANEPDLAQRSTILVEERQRMATEALKLVRDGDVLMIDYRLTRATKLNNSLLVWGFGGASQRRWATGS